MPSSLPSSSDGIPEEWLGEDNEEEKYESSFAVSRDMKDTLLNARTYAGFSTTKDFCEHLIEDKAYDVISMAVGVPDYLDFVSAYESEMLRDELDSNFEYTSDKIKMGPLDHTILVEIGVYESGGVSHVSTKLDMARSDIMRICLVMGLNDMIQEGIYKPQSYLREKRIMVLDEKINNMMARYHRMFESFVKLKFVDSLEYVEAMFEDGGRGIYAFSDFYAKEFKGSDGYDRMMKIGCEEPFENIDRLVEEHTDVDIEVDSYDG